MLKNNESKVSPSTPERPTVTDSKKRRFESTESPSVTADALDGAASPITPHKSHAIKKMAYDSADAQASPIAPTKKPSINSNNFMLSLFGRKPFVHKLVVETLTNAPHTPTKHTGEWLASQKRLSTSLNAEKFSYNGRAEEQAHSDSKNPISPSYKFRTTTPSQTQLIRSDTIWTFERPITVTLPDGTQKVTSETHSYVIHSDIKTHTPQFYNALSAAKKLMCDEEHTKENDDEEEKATVSPRPKHPLREEMLRPICFNKPTRTPRNTNEKTITAMGETADAVSKPELLTNKTLEFLEKNMHHYKRIKDSSSWEVCFMTYPETLRFCDDLFARADIRNWLIKDFSTIPTNFATTWRNELEARLDEMLTLIYSSFEWNHKRAATLGGLNEPSNLYAGSRGCNSNFDTVEKMIRKYITQVKDVKVTPIASDDHATPKEVLIKVMLSNEVVFHTTLHPTGRNKPTAQSILLLNKIAQHYLDPTTALPFPTTDAATSSPLSTNAPTIMV